MTDGHRHDSYPVLPNEASSLPSHVSRCAERYMALVRFHHELSRRMRRLAIEARIYTALNVAAIGAVAWLLKQLLEKR